VVPVNNYPTLIGRTKNTIEIINVFLIKNCNGTFNYVKLPWRMTRNIPLRSLSLHEGFVFKGLRGTDGRGRTSDLGE